MYKKFCFIIFCLMSCNLTGAKIYAGKVNISQILSENDLPIPLEIGRHIMSFVRFDNVGEARLASRQFFSWCSAKETNKKVLSFLKEVQRTEKFNIDEETEKLYKQTIQSLNFSETYDNDKKSQIDTVEELQLKILSN